MKNISKTGLYASTLALAFVIPNLAIAQNTTTGSGALASITTGTNNTADGANALNACTSGSLNVAVGRNAVSLLQTGGENIGVGANALHSNVSGTANTAIGYDALETTTVSYGTAVGYAALINSTDGNANVALGFEALYGNTSGSDNVGVGYGALSTNTGGYLSGNDNTAVGTNALANVNGVAFTEEGDNNTALGSGSGYAMTTGSGNTTVGWYAGQYFVSGSNNTAIGANAGSTSGTVFNTTALGENATVTASNSVVIGNSSVTSIGGYQGWSNLSDARFKTNVRSNVPGLNFIKKLQPVTFSWNMDKLDAFDGVSRAPRSQAEQEAREQKEKSQQTGFLAQQVEQAATECGYEFSGVIKPANAQSKYQLSYAEFVVPLVKAVQEQQQEIEELRALVRKQAVSSNKSDSMPQHAGLFGGPSGEVMAILAGLLGLIYLKRAKAQISVVRE